MHLAHLPELCKECFINTLKKRIKRELKGLHNRKVLMMNDGSAAAILLKTAVSEATSGTPVVLDEHPDLSKISGYDAVLVPWIADNLVRDFLKEILYNVEMKPDPENMIRPLRAITEQEIEEFARLESLPYEKKNDELHSFIEELEKKYPSTKFAILKSLEALKN